MGGVAGASGKAGEGLGRARGAWVDGWWCCDEGRWRPSVRPIKPRWPLLKLVEGWRLVDVEVVIMR